MPVGESLGEAKADVPSSARIERLREVGADFVSPQTRSRRGLWPLLLSLPAACGGSGGPCNSPMCEYADNTVHLQQGTIEWTIGGVLAQSANVVSETQPSGECWLTVRPGSISSPTNPTTWRKTEETRLHTECTLTGTAATIDGGTLIPSWSMMIPYAADPRLWAVGQTVLLETLESEVCASVGFLPVPETLSVFVEEAIGGAAEFPAIVTVDYHRVFRIDYATLGRWPAGTPSCQPEATVNVTLTLTQTAVDFSLERHWCYGCK